MKRTVFLSASLAVVIAPVMGCDGIRKKTPAESKPAAEASTEGKIPVVAVVPVEKRSVPQTVSLTGAVRALSEASVFPKMPGRVTRVFVDVGQRVKAGDVLATQESNDLSWRVKQAEAMLRGAQAGLENARLQHKTATRAWERAQTLKKTEAISAVDFEQAETAFQVTAVAVQAAEAQAAQADSALGLANQTLADSRMTAPFSGVVAKKSIELGSQASPAQAAFVVQDPSGLKMVGTVPSFEVARLKRGQAVAVFVDDLPGKALEGKLTSIAPSLDADTRRAAVEVSLAPVEGVLPNMFGRAEITLGQKDDALVVPASAIISTPEGALAYVVREKKASAVRPKLGGRVGDLIVIESGLDVGEQVIVSGDTGVEDGRPVAFAP